MPSARWRTTEHGSEQRERRNASTSELGNQNSLPSARWRTTEHGSEQRETSSFGNQNELAEYEPLIRHVASHKKTRYLTDAERESEAWRGATRAYSSFQPERGAKLSTWICLKAKFAIEDAERKERVHALRESCRDTEFFSRIVGSGDPNEESENENSALDEKRRIVAQALQTLDERTRNIIERVWFLGETQAEIAARLTISASWCSRLYRRGMKRLEAELIRLMADEKNG